MDLILCHLAADFDALGAAVGTSRLYPGSRIVLTGGCQSSVQEFLSLYRDAYPFLEMRAVHPEGIRRLILVDCHRPDRLGKAAEWLKLPHVEISIYDHHPPVHPFDFPVNQAYIEPVGSTCTLVVEQLQAQTIVLTPFEAVVLALGIHVDTGSLLFPDTTVRDAQALVWLMQQGVSPSILARYVESSLSPPFRELLCQGLDQIRIQQIQGYRLGTLVLHLDKFVSGLAGLVMNLIDLTGVDVMILVAEQGERISIIGRARQDFFQLQKVLEPYGGGGHSRAAAATFRSRQDMLSKALLSDRNDPNLSPEIEVNLKDPNQVLDSILKRIIERIPKPVTAQDLMSSPVRTIRGDTSIAEAQRVLLRYGHSGLVVTDAQAQLVGVISRRDMDIALHHGFGHAPVKGYMTTAVKTVDPDTPLDQIQACMVKWDIGRLPVVREGRLLGIVTRTDVLRHLHHLPSESEENTDPISLHSLSLELLAPEHQRILTQAAYIAEAIGLRLYLVGGLVRDLLLGQKSDDIDLVVDRPYPLLPGEPPEGAGIQLGRALQQHFTEARLEIHGKYQTVALIWPNGFWLDIATARTEFYPYPAAAPEVDLGSIQQDLYRRDFTINALAVQLTGSNFGKILDFFGGLEDLKAKRIRVLHVNSFIEDPTRIFRAVRFAVRLGFDLDPETEGYLRGAVSSGLHDAVGGDRLKNELFYILREPGWANAFQQLATWGALRCIHPQLSWGQELKQQVKRLGSWFNHFQQNYPELSRHDLPQLRLELMLSHLPQAHQAAQQLHLTQAGIDRLLMLPQWQAHLHSLFQAKPSPSQILQALHPYRVIEILMLSAVSTPEIRRILYQYLRHWRRCKPLLDGHTLRQLGYQPGPLFQRILSRLREAQVDGKVTTLAEALTWIRTEFPLS
jgi:tRNA nucleotidyltransferase (CCA-adding enzyme)